MKKRFPVVLTAILCTLSLVVGVAASDIVKKISAELRPDFTVVIDGEKKIFENAQGDVVYPVLYDGTTYLPVRAIGELMGKKVYWYENEKRIELKQEDEPTVTDADVIVTDSAVEGKKDKEKDSGKKDTGKEKEVDVKDNKKDNEVKKDDAKKDKVVGNADIITKERAKDIVLKKAGLSESDVKFILAEKEYDNGIIIYDIEFRKGFTEYDAEVDAVSGEIIDWEVD